jgi:hypothetical protein
MKSNIWKDGSVHWSVLLYWTNWLVKIKTSLEPVTLKDDHYEVNDYWLNKVMLSGLTVES